MLYITLILFQMKYRWRLYFARCFFKVFLYIAAMFQNLNKRLYTKCKRVKDLFDSSKRPHQSTCIVFLKQQTKRRLPVALVRETATRELTQMKFSFLFLVLFSSGCYFCWLAFRSRPSAIDLSLPCFNNNNLFLYSDF